MSNTGANAETSDKKTTETERDVNEGKCSDAPSRFKRQLPTTISPDRRATSKAAKRSSGPKKSLAFGQEKENLVNVDVHMNDEGLLDKPTTRVKTVIVYPNGNVECRRSFLQESASIIINISKRNWKTVANTIFKHEEIKAELLGPITKAVDTETTTTTTTTTILFCLIHRKNSAKNKLNLNKQKNYSKWYKLNELSSYKVYYA